MDSHIKLGPRGELECIACHNPHNNELGDFLRMPKREGALCNTCHQMDGWRLSSHALSGKAVPQTLAGMEKLDFTSMADNACASCHVSHGAPQSERLLRKRAVDLCIDCHNGITAVDVSSVAGQFSGHRFNRFVNRHSPEEDPHSMPHHVDCVDCHNPHAVRPNPLATGVAALARPGFQIAPAMEHVPGVSVGGAALETARHDYEVCFRCHADNPAPSKDRIVRDRDDFGNIRRQFQPSAASAHPVTFTARNTADVPSLLPAARARPTMTCQDCHNNPDARQLGGGGANGPHGSRFPFLLAARYETADFTIETPQNYALCYQCHDRASILADRSFAFHNQHIVRGRTPCSACHSPHGVQGNASEHSHLINFDVSIVQGERQFVDRGQFRGSCTLTCHGVRHVNLTYGN